MRFVLFFPLVLILAAHPSGTRAQSGEPVSGEPTLALQFRDADIAKVVEAVGRATGHSFIFDDRLRGRITIVAPRRVTAEEAINLLDAALLIKGFASIPGPHGMRKIVSTEAAVGSSPWTLGELSDQREAPLVTLVQLRGARPEDVLGALRSLRARSLLTVSYPEAQSVILAGPENVVRASIALIRTLDQAAGVELIVRRLRYSSAAHVSTLIEQVFECTVRDPGELWSDDRTNSLIVRTTPARMPEFRDFIDRVDRPQEASGAIRVYKVLNVDPEPLSELLNGLALGSPGPTGRPGPRSDRSASLEGRDYAVVLDSASGSLVVRADPSTHALISELIEELDTSPPRISLDVIVFEVQLSESLDLGFEALVVAEPTEGTSVAVAVNPGGGGSRSGTRADGGLFAGFTRSPLMIPVIGDDGVGVDLVTPRKSAAIHADARAIDTRILLSPHLLVISGEEQELSVGNNIPIPVATTTGGGQVGSLLQNQQTIERQDVGVVLRVTATAGQVGGVHLDLDLDISDVVESLAGPVEAVGPTLATRRITATINLHDGQLAVIGVAGRPSSKTTVTGVPFLKDIPFLGYFFKSVSETQIKSELVVAVTARLLRTPEEDIAETIRRRIAFQRALAGAGPLSEDGAPFAVLVATRQLKEDAEAIAESVAPEGQVVPWEQAGQTLFDIYLTGFEEFPDAAAEALRIRERGWNPQVIVVPRNSPSAR